MWEYVYCLCTGFGAEAGVFGIALFLGNTAAFEFILSSIGEIDDDAEDVSLLESNGSMIWFVLLIVTLCLCFLGVLVVGERGEWGDLSDDLFGDLSDDRMTLTILDNVPRRIGDSGGVAQSDLRAVGVNTERCKYWWGSSVDADFWCAICSRFGVQCVRSIVTDDRLMGTEGELTLKIGIFGDCTECHCGDFTSSNLSTESVGLNMRKLVGDWESLIGLNVCEERR